MLSSILFGPFCAIRERFGHSRFVILDDLFPNLASGFRVTEYTYLLNHLSSADVLSTAKGIRFAGTARTFVHAKRQFSRHYPLLTPRVKRWFSWIPPNATGAYTIFLNNILEFLPAIEKASIGFVFTLYPGGGFRLNDAEVDSQLRRVFCSHSFRHVIVTQHTSLNYLLSNRLCPPDKATLILGNPVALEDLSSQSLSDRWKSTTWNVCFVAHKYTARGEDKGYDLFVRAAQILALRRADIHYHVVGNFSMSDFELGSIGGNFTFYGARDYNWLRQFLGKMHLIISPNVPFKFAPGAFDGFPTGSCVHAALAGAAVMCTDCLNENSTYKDGTDLVIIPPEPQSIANQVEFLLSNPERLRALAESGQNVFRKAYAVERQLEPRMGVLQRVFGMSDSTA